MAISTIGGGSAAATGELGGTVVAAGHITIAGGKIPVAGGVAPGDYLIEFRGNVTSTFVYGYVGTTPVKLTSSQIQTYVPNGSSNNSPALTNIITVPTSLDGFYLPANYFVGGVVIRKWTAATPATLTEYTWNSTGQSTGGRAMQLTRQGYNLAYGNSKYVACEYQSSGAFIRSTDGYSWSVTTYIGYPYAIAFGNGYFVNTYNGYSYAKIGTSTDGASITERSLPTNTYWYWVHYCSSLSTPKWIVTGSNGKACTATDPTGTWSAANIASLTGYDYSALQVRDGGGIAVAVNNGSATYYTSTDLSTWTQRTLPVSTGDPYLAYANGRFVLSGMAGGKIWVSLNGIDWIGYNAPVSAVGTAMGSYAVTAANGVFCLGSYQYSSTHYAFFSTDGINWTARDISGSYDYKVNGAGSYFIAMANNNANVATYITNAAANSLT